jgi:hypothetical protein
MIYNYKIFQTKYKFEKFQEVYSGIIEAENDIQALDSLFHIFNIEHPMDFKGHNLSVGDIVKLNDKVYFCANSGWNEF